jgi:hypothetical protein
MYAERGPAARRFYTLFSDAESKVNFGFGFPRGHGADWVQDGFLRLSGRAALLRRPRIQGRAAALPYQSGGEFCAAPGLFALVAIGLTTGERKSMFLPAVIVAVSAGTSGSGIPLRLEAGPMDCRAV